MPCNTSEVNRRFGVTSRFDFQGGRINQAINQHESGSKQGSFETSVDFHMKVWRYIPEDRDLDGHRCESLNTYKFPLLKGNNFSTSARGEKKYC
jgi:hypothetical protein